MPKIRHPVPKKITSRVGPASAFKVSPALKAELQRVAKLEGRTVSTTTYFLVLHGLLKYYDTGQLFTEELSDLSFLTKRKR